jgi:phosphotransacetylase
MVIDGEVQADFALNPEMLKEKFPFSKLAGKKVNTLIFPNLDSANITYKLLKELNHDSIGPIMLGMGKPVHIFNWEQVWKKWLIWLPLLLMLKKSRRKKIRQFY